MEINFQIYKDRNNDYKTTKALIKKTMELMRFKLPEWPFMIDVGLGIGNRWGQTVDFDFDPGTLEILQPKSDPITDKDICKALGIVIEKKEEKPVEDNVEETFTIEY